MQHINKWVFILLRIGIAIGLIDYLIVSGAIDWGYFLGLINAWYVSIVAILAFIFSNILLAWRLQILMHAHQLRLPLLSSIRLTFIGLFFNTYLPGATGGDLVKIYYASKGNPGRRTEIITIIIFDRLVGMFGLFSLPILLTPFYLSTVMGSAILQALVMATCLVTIIMLVSAIVGMKMNVEHGRFFIWIYKKFPKGDLIKRILITMHAYRHNKIKVLGGLLVSYAIQVSMIGMLLMLAAVTLPSGVDSLMTLLVPLGFIANSLPFTPGGVGVGEAALDSLFKLFGLQGGAELLLGWRLFMILTGLIGLMFYLKGEKRFVHHSD